MTRTDTLSQSRVRHYYECGQTRENVTCEGVLFTPLVDYDSYAFCQALSKGIDGEDWGEMYDAYKEMRRSHKRPRKQTPSGK